MSVSKSRRVLSQICALVGGLVALFGLVLAIALAVWSWLSPEPDVQIFEPMVPDDDNRAI